MLPQDFYTQSRASEGVRIEMTDPSGRREWARVRSVLSPEFRKASQEALRKALLGGPKQGGELKKWKRRCRAELVAALIAEWSLPMQAEQDKADLFERNPRLRRQIEAISEDVSLHFGVQA